MFEYVTKVQHGSDSERWWVGHHIGSDDTGGFGVQDINVQDCRPIWPRILQL